MVGRLNRIPSREQVLVNAVTPDQNSLRRGMPSLRDAGLFFYAHPALKGGAISFRPASRDWVSVVQRPNLCCHEELHGKLRRHHGVCVMAVPPLRGSVIFPSFTAG